MNAPVLPKRRMNVDEFLAWSKHQQGRFELVNGEVVAMAPERARHNLAKLAVARALQDAVTTAQVPCTVFTGGMSVVTGTHWLREPDAAVQCGVQVNLDSMTLEAPLIVVEVISPSTERTDTGSKLLDYFSVASIRHYLIVALEQRAIIHHCRNDEGEIATRILHDGQIDLTPPGIAVSVANLLGPEPSIKGEA